MGRGLLIIVSGLFIVYGIIQNSLHERQKAVTQLNVDFAEKAKAMTIANTMADLAFAEINQDPNNPQAGNFSEMDMLGGKGSVEISFDLPFAPANPFVEEKVIRAVGKFITKNDTVRSEVEVRARRRAFSRYAYFTNIEQGIKFVTGDVLNGPLHTNGTINIQGDPIFNGEVTSPTNPDMTSGSNPQFNGGRDFNAKAIDLPVEVPELGQEASTGGLRFTEPIKVTFFNDNSSGTDIGKVAISTYTVTGSECIRWWRGQCRETRQTYGWGTPAEYILDNYNGIISSSGDVYVEGTVNGDYTLHSEDDVRIIGDIRYHNDPRNNPSSDDFLGIVSEKNTIVDKDAHRAEGNQDLDIHASIMALDDEDSFYVENYNDGQSRGVLNILGGLIQFERGAVGLTNGSGYLKNYTYDERYLGHAPRGFPPSDIYDYISWQTEYK